MLAQVPTMKFAGVQVPIASFEKEVIQFNLKSLTVALTAITQPREKTYLFWKASRKTGSSPPQPLHLEGIQ